eukprot:6178720-Pleurochrysis_carterae.AAC.1
MKVLLCHPIQTRRAYLDKMTLAKDVLGRRSWCAYDACCATTPQSAQEKRCKGSVHTRLDKNVGDE